MKNKTEKFWILAMLIVAAFTLYMTGHPHAAWSFGVGAIVAGIFL